MQRSVDHAEPNPNRYICIAAPTSVSQGILRKSWKKACKCQNIIVTFFNFTTFIKTSKVVKTYIDCIWNFYNIIFIHSCHCKLLYLHFQNCLGSQRLHKLITISHLKMVHVQAIRLLNEILPTSLPFFWLYTMVLWPLNFGKVIRSISHKICLNNVI